MCDGIVTGMMLCIDWFGFETDDSSVSVRVEWKSGERSVSVRGVSVGDESKQQAAHSTVHSRQQRILVRVTSILWWSDGFVCQRAVWESRQVSKRYMRSLHGVLPQQ